MESVVAWPLEGQFRRYKRGPNLYSVRLDETCLTVKDDTQEQVVQVSDLVGCVCLQPREAQQSLQDQKTTAACFTLLAYQLNGKKRTRLALCFEADSEDSFEKNLEVTLSWKRAVRHAIRNSGAAKAQVDHSKKLLLFINPNSGPGRARQIYKKQVQSLLVEAEVEHEVVVTEKSNHAHDMVKELDLTQYSGLVILSGDGLLYEVYNGLLARPDWEEAIQYPIGIIPGGSGNGLARSLAQWLSEPYMDNPVLVSTLNVVYGRLSPMDLVMIETANEKKLLSFLSIGFGLISDIDIESERLRVIGESRFALWALTRLANLRTYRATISFKRSSAFTSSLAPERVVPPLLRSQTLQEQGAASPTGIKYLPRSYSVQPQEEPQDDALVGMTHSPVVVENTDPADSFPSKSEEVQGQQEEGAGWVSSLPGLHQPVPEDWETIEDDFVLVYCCHQSHISSDLFIAPQATPDDGCMWIMILRQSCPRSTLIKLLLEMKGPHLKLPGVEMVPVEAVRIVPDTKTNKGYLTVDGEVIPWSPIQFQVLHKKGRIMTR